MTEFPTAAFHEGYVDRFYETPLALFSVFARKPQLVLGEFRTWTKEKNYEPLNQVT